MRQDISSKAEAKWQAHAEQISRRYMLIMGFVVLVTFCGGIAASRIARNDLTPIISMLLGGTAIAVIIGMCLHVWLKLRSEVLGYIAYLSMATTMSYMIATGGGVLDILGQIPIFLASGLVFFWKTKHSIICLAYNMIIGWLFLFLFNEGSSQDWVGWWAILFPIGLGMVLLIRFKYHAWRKNFIVSHQLEATNEELMRSHELIQEKQFLLEQKDKQITASVNYASRIQKAMLPYPERMEQVFPEYFVLFKPKDVVSGDFYWMQNKKGKTFFALGDCTGHGVPGGFMSMIAHALLDSIVLERGLSHPSKILQALDSGIRKALQQKESDNQDGLDISLCVFDFEQRMMWFAGVKQTLVYIQNGSLQTIKGDRAYIGGGTKNLHVFTSHELSLNHITHLYLSSDGYCDQFGGALNKKILEKKYFSLLGEIQGLSMQEQEQALNDYFEEWRSLGNEDQIDDVLVIGLRLA